MSLREINIQKLKHKDPLIRKNGAQNILRRGGANELEALQNALIIEEDPKVIKWLAYVIAMIGGQKSILFLDAKKKITKSELAIDWIDISRSILIDKSNAQPDLGYVYKLLRSKNPDTLRKGILQSYHITDMPRDLREILYRMLQNEREDLRQWATLSLGNSTELPSVYPILSGLSDSNYLVREWSEFVLSKIKDHSTFSDLLEKLVDPHPRVREWAVKAISKFEFPEIPRILIQHYQNETDELCREGIITSLANWADLDFVGDFLLSLMKNERNLIIISAIIDIFAQNRSLGNHPGLVDGLLYMEERIDDPTARLQLGTSLIQIFTSEEITLAKRIFESKKIRLLVDLLKDLQLANVEPDSLFPIEETTKDKRLWLSSGQSQALLSGISKIDIGLIIALKEEFRDFLESAKINIDKFSYSSRQERETGDIYYEFLAPNIKGNSYSCVASLLGEMGASKAALQADRMISIFRPKTLIIIGLAASINKDVYIGDVVVAKHIDGYIESSKIVSSRSGRNIQYKLSGDILQSSGNLLNQVTNFEFTHVEGFQTWHTHCETFTRDVLSEPLFVKMIQQRSMHSVPRLFEGVLASGPSVVAAAEFVNWLIQRNRNYLALEMESIGFMKAANSQNRPPQTLVIRGISDFGDHLKSSFDAIEDGGMRRVAMKNALELFWGLLKCGIFTQED